VASGGFLRGVVQIFGEFRIPTKYRSLCTGFLGIFQPVYGMISIANTKTTSFPKKYYTPLSERGFSIVGHLVEIPKD
jgi:hypothetical protein